MKPKRRIRAGRLLVLSGTVCAFILIIAGIIGRLVYKPNKNVVILNGVMEYYQHPDYPTGCESVALYILLQYYGVDVTVDKIIDELPKGPMPYEQDGVMYGANPEREFVGSPLDDGSYGVFNRPIAAVAEKFKSGVFTFENATIEDIREVLDSGNPVLAWYVIDPDKKIEYRRSWLDYKTGEKIKWPRGEHAVVVYGYDGNKSFFISDPNTGSCFSVSARKFAGPFKKMGGRIVFYRDNDLTY